MFETEEMLLDGRTIFPVKKTSGEICGATGRNLNNSPKYISRGESGFIGNVAIKNKTLIFCEGVFATIQAEQQGFDNVIGFMNEDVFTNETLSYLKTKNKSVVLFFDQDNVGRKAAYAVAEKMKNSGISVKVFETDIAIDMQEYLAQGYSVQEILGN